MFLINKRYDVYFCELGIGGYKKICNYDWKVIEVGNQNVKFLFNKKEVIVNLASPLFMFAILKD